MCVQVNFAFDYTTSKSGPTSSCLLDIIMLSCLVVRLGVGETGPTTTSRVVVATR